MFEPLPEGPGRGAHSPLGWAAAVSEGPGSRARWSRGAGSSALTLLTTPLQRARPTQTPRAPRPATPGPGGRVLQLLRRACSLGGTEPCLRGESVRHRPGPGRRPDPALPSSFALGAVGAVTRQGAASAGSQGGCKATPAVPGALGGAERTGGGAGGTAASPESVDFSPLPVSPPSLETQSPAQPLCSRSSSADTGVPRGREAPVAETRTHRNSKSRWGLGRCSLGAVCRAPGARWTPRAQVWGNSLCPVDFRAACVRGSLQDARLPF